MFVPAAAGLFDGQWGRIGLPLTMFEPHGTFYVPREVLPPDFRHKDVAAWEVEDQPNYALHKHSCRFRATGFADGPLEVVRVECDSSDPDECRRLLEAGLDFIPARRDNFALVEFQDGLLAKVKFRPHPDRPRRYLVAAGDLVDPLEAWPKAQTPQLISINCDGAVHRFAASAELPTAPERLDLATLQEAFSSIKRGGGLGSPVSASPAELRRAVERLQEVAATFAAPAWTARRARLNHFLDVAKQAAEDRERWEELLAGHQLFREAVESIVGKRLDGLRAEVREKLLEEETELKDRLAGLATECSDWEGLARSAREEAEQLQQNVRELSGQRDEIVGELERKRAEREGAKLQTSPSHAGENGAVKPQIDAQPVAVVPDPTVPRFSFAPEPSAEPGEPLKTAKEALKRLEDNLHALGVLKVSARVLARETLVALSLGQMVFFRGSVGGPVAEVCAASLAGGGVLNVPVSLGASQPFELPRNFGEGPAAVVFEGVNRSCFGTYGQSVGEILRGRAFGRSAQPWPFFFGVIGDGPSFLPPGPELVTFGPVFDTDCLSWDLRKAAGEIKVARCDTGALELKDAAEPEEWADLIDELFDAGNVVWERQARAALRRLAALAESGRPAQAGASFLFGWILPRLFASGAQPAAFGERFSPDCAPCLCKKSLTHYLNGDYPSV
ncbi:MAG: hypothetical protein ACYC3I_25265 [Gemmataceae bacterium]